MSLKYYRCGWAICLIASSLLGNSALALDGFPNPLEQRCWAKYAAGRTSPSFSNDLRSLEFSTFRNDARVYSPFRVEFSVSGMGIVPANNKRNNTGHHHILIDTKLPAAPTSPIPFSDKHVHFGKGQTSAILTLAPGKHTLRLLFADHEHKPYYLFSKEITVDVIGPRSMLATAGAPTINPARFDESCAAWYDNVITEPSPTGRAAYFQNIRDGDTLRTNSVLRFGAEAFGVCAVGIKVDKTGYFNLEIASRNRLPRRISFRDGQTQIAPDLEPGNYQLSLQLVGQDEKPIGEADLVNVRVAGEHKWGER